jgi:hypothetical protein
MGPAIRDRQRSSENTSPTKGSRSRKNTGNTGREMSPGKVKQSSRVVKKRSKSSLDKKAKKAKWIDR